jgi:hypothetical protein
MLVPFDAANDTWDSLGAGVDQDDIESRSTFDSQIGLVDGSGSTGTGTVSVSVIPDLVAWQTGAINYGWVMPGWTGNTDGTGFAPGESPDVSDRPRLRVLWLPAGTPSVSFRQDVDGYTGARDTRLRKSLPDTENSTLAGLFVDAEATAGQADPDQVLIRFDDIIGSITNQIPPGAQVHAAMLDLASVAGSAMGDGGTFHAMLVPWQDTDTWNTMINGVTANDLEAATNATTTAGDASLNPNVQGGYLSFELTPDVQAWVNGARTNHGWAVLPWPGGGDGWGFSSAEAGTERDRPRLRVYFTVPIVITITKITRGPASATLQFTGPAGAACSVWRAAAVSGPYSIIGPATLQPDGTAAFTDNSPPPGAAFYRVSTP